MKRFAKVIAAVISLISISASAAPPALQLPTGACAGLVKKTSVVTYTDADSAAGRIGPDNVPYLHFYLDFDNGLADIGFMDERNRLGSDEDDGQTIQESALLTQDAAFSLKLSSTFRYALEFNIDYIELNGESSSTQGLLIPSNGGATFLVTFLNSPFTGVCQKI